MFLDCTKQGHPQFSQRYYKANMTKESDLTKKVNSSFEVCKVMQSFNVIMFFFSEKPMELGVNVYFNTLSSLDEENMVSYQRGIFSMTRGHLYLQITSKFNNC